MKRKLIFTLLSLIMTCNLWAQDKKSLEEKSKQIYEYTIASEYEKLLDLTYPKLYDLVPRETMKEILEGMMTAPDYTMAMVNTPPNFIFGPIQKIGSGSYSKVTHDIALKMTFNKPVTNPEGLINAYKTSMKTENVSYSEKDNSLLIKKRTEMIAVADSLSNNQWTFVNNNGREIMKMLFSDEVIKKLGL